MLLINMEYTDEELLRSINLNLQKGRAGEVGALVRELVDRGIEPNVILKDGLIKGMDQLGLRFRDNEVFVPEVLTAARAMICGINVLKPYLVHSYSLPIGRVILGTVKGDIHDIGKNLVRIMMESKSIEVIDLGTDVSAVQFVQAARQYDCNIICCSALLTTTMHYFCDVVKAFEKAGMRDQVKIMVGGAPVTDAFCKNIGADIYTEDATSAAEEALKLIRQQKHK